jgi:hypothetical protein
VQEYEFDALMRTADSEPSGERFEPFTQGRKQAPWQAFPEPSAFARASGGSGASLCRPPLMPVVWMRVNLLGVTHEETCLASKRVGHESACVHVAEWAAFEDKGAASASAPAPGE